MYKAESDPYCYSDRDVLKNKAGLTSADALEAFETAMTFARSEEPMPHGRFSARHYRRIHHHLFQDVYGWAGKYRTVRLTKGASTFCYPENIAPEMQRLFSDLREQQFLKSLTPRLFTETAAHFLAELNAIHPFREGNGRSQFTYIAMLAGHAGHPMDLDRLEPDRWLAAMIKSFGGDEQPLVRVLAGLIDP